LYLFLNFVILIFRLCGFPPFYDDDNFELFEKIKKGQFDFPSPSWDNISPDAINIVKALLKVDPTERMTPD
jgi:serine/threonine protein kinase